MVRGVILGDLPLGLFFPSEYVDGGRRQIECDCARSAGDQSEPIKHSGWYRTTGPIGEKAEFPVRCKACETSGHNSQNSVGGHGQKRQAANDRSGAAQTKWRKITDAGRIAPNNRNFWKFPRERISKTSTEFYGGNARPFQATG